MAGNVDEEAVEQLVERLALLTGESPIQVVRTSLANRLQEIEAEAARRQRVERYMASLQREV